MKIVITSPGTPEGTDQSWELTFVKESGGDVCFHKAEILSGFGN